MADKLTCRHCGVEVVRTPYKHDRGQWAAENAFGATFCTNLQSSSAGDREYGHQVEPWPEPSDVEGMDRWLAQ